MLVQLVVLTLRRIQELVKWELKLFVVIPRNCHFKKLKSEAESSRCFHLALNNYLQPAFLNNGHANSEESYSLALGVARMA